MSSEERLQALVQEVGPLLDPEGIAWFEDEASWAIVIDEHTQIDLIHDPDHDRLVCNCDLGPIPTERQPRVHEMLLRLNYLWQDTGGLRGALDD